MAFRVCTDVIIQCSAFCIETIRNSRNALKEGIFLDFTPIDFKFADEYIEEFPILLTPILMCLHKSSLSLQNLAVEVISLRKCS